MKLCRIEAQYILKQFQVDENVLVCNPIQEHFIPGHIRLIYYIITEEGGHWICRLTDDNHYPQYIIEKQYTFASLLHRYGVHTPFNAQVGGKYCLAIVLKQHLFNVTLETFCGKDLDDVNINIFRSMGRLLGNMHCISENHPVKIGFSTIFKAIQNKQADLTSVFEREIPQFLQDAQSGILIELHNCLVKDLQSIWDKLPRGAVHGDLGIFNNLVVDSSGIGVIDFNLAGDEVYLGELLISFYSSIHKYTWRDKISSIQQEEAFIAFLSGYNEERKLGAKEKEAFPATAALFDGLFYCKSVIEEYNSNKDSYVLEKFKSANIHFSIFHHSIPEEILC